MKFKKFKKTVYKISLIGIVLSLLTTTMFSSGLENLTNGSFDDGTSKTATGWTCDVIQKAESGNASYYDFFLHPDSNDNRYLIFENGFNREVYCKQNFEKTKVSEFDNSVSLVFDYKIFKESDFFAITIVGFDPALSWDVSLEFYVKSQSKTDTQYDKYYQVSSQLIQTGWIANAFNIYEIWTAKGLSASVDLREIKIYSVAYFNEPVSDYNSVGFDDISLFSSGKGGGSGGQLICYDAFTCGEW